MLRFLAKIGRLPAAKYVVPTIAATIPGGFMAYHTFALESVKNFLVVKDGLNERRMSENLKNLINKVLGETKDFVKTAKSFTKSKDIEFFLSVTPTYAGTTQNRQGCIVGLPEYIDYETIHDIPNGRLALTPLPFFKLKSPESEESGKVEEKNVDENVPGEVKKGIYGSDGRPRSIQIDVNSEQGKRYVDSLLLSENAKKFLIARQVFYTDTHQIIIDFFALMLHCVLPMVMANAARQYIPPFNRNIAQRIPFYFLSGSLAYFHFFIFKDLLQRNYDGESDKRAAQINDNYLDGGIEYYTKFIQRNLAIRSMHKAFERTIDEKGNLINLGWRNKELKITDRLEKLIALKDGVGQKV